MAPSIIATLRAALAALPALPPAALAAAALVGVLSVGSWLLPWLLTFATFSATRFKARYARCEWAVVTGGSSGIGFALCKKLAAQGINVVVLAVPDALLAKAAAELQAAFPGVQVRAVGADLGKDASTYLPAVAAATADIHVSLLFNNAGYIVTGFFAETPLDKWLANAQCNAMAAVAITHLFVGRMRAAGLKGAVAFTSSPANIIPSPFSTLYGATKAMVTHFASSLACELGPEGIDVAVMHPSPVATRFYAGTHALPTLKMFQSTATGPDAVAEVLLRGIGRTVIIDQGCVRGRRRRRERRRRRGRRGRRWQGWQRGRRWQGRRQGRRRVGWGSLLLLAPWRSSDHLL